MIPISSKICCFCGHEQHPVRSLKLAIPSEKEPENWWVHSICFNRLRDNSVKPDDLRNYGHIPKNACCVFCGKKLPIIGQHPYCFDIEDKNLSKRYWTHADCLTKNIIDTLKDLFK